MKLGINEATCMESSDLLEDLQLCEECGYDFIEIRLDMLAKFLETNSWVVLEQFFSESNVQPIGYNSIENINSCSTKEWKEKVASIQLACQAKQKIGGEMLVVVPTVDIESTFEKEIIVEDSVKNLKKIIEIVAPYDMKIAFEPIGSQRCCVRTLAEAYEIIEIVNSKQVGLVVDAFNLHLSNEWADLAVLKEIPVDKIFIYHINDADDLPVALLDHCHRLFPGNGTIPLEKISQVLYEKKYEGVCSLELFNPSYWQMDPADVFRIGKEKTMRYL